MGILCLKLLEDGVENPIGGAVNSDFKIQALRLELGRDTMPTKPFPLRRPMLGGIEADVMEGAYAAIAAKNFAFAATSRADIVIIKLQRDVSQL